MSTGDVIIAPGEEILFDEVTDGDVVTVDEVVIVDEVVTAVDVVTWWDVVLKNKINVILIILKFLSRP